MLDRMPNHLPTVRVKSCHTLPIVDLCPVSNNPGPGSTVSVRYHAHAWFLEVYSLEGYVRSYVHGKRDERGEIIIRDMEQTLQQLCYDVAMLLDTEVLVTADLHLQSGQLLTLDVRYYPAEHAGSTQY